MNNEDLRKVADANSRTTCQELAEMLINQHKQWTIMLLLTTLLTAHANDATNESYKTIDGRRTTDDRNILTSRALLANKDGSSEDADWLTIKESESATRPSDKQNNANGYSQVEKEKQDDEFTKNSPELKYEHINSSYPQIGSENITNLVNESSIIKQGDATAFSYHNANISNLNQSSTRKQKIFGINNNLGFVEEIHVFQEEEEEEILVEIVDEDADEAEEKVTHIYLEEKALDNAVDFGMKSVEELVHVKEPLWYNMGLFLDKTDPGSKIATFGRPINDLAAEVSRFGFLTLEASRKMAESFPENVSRQATGFPGSFHPRQLEGSCPLKGIPRCPPASRRYRTADGTCNNLENPWKGSALLPMQRFLPPAYEDGIQNIRQSVLGPRLPSAREISVQIHGDRDNELPTVTLMFMQWGQFIDHDVTSVVKSRSFNGSVPRCCRRGGQGFLPQEFLHPTCLPIEVPKDDWFFGPFGVRCMEFIRSAPSTRINCDLGWREQINQVTAFIDASAIYGSDIDTAEAMRTFRNGKLIYGRSHSQGPLQPPDPPGGELCRSGALTDDCFQSGDGRVSEQPGLTAMHTIWVRFHNKAATTLSKFNPHWSDEKLYQETRKIVYSIIQHITYREFLPIVLGPEVMDLFELRLVRKGYYLLYDSKVNPAIANSFSTAAYRFGHSMVQNSFVRTDHKHRPLFNNVSLHEELNNFENIWSFGSVDRLLLGFANQPTQRRDEAICDELSNHLFQSPNSPFGSDLAAINIQRGRDHGLPPYTSWREPCGLSPVRTWNDLKGIFSVGIVNRFRTVYRHVDDIDLFSGGLAEKPVRGGVVGPTFACIIAQQFLNLRKGDRFWYENSGFESSFTPAQLQQIRHVTLSQILCHTLDEIETIQPFVFLSPDNFRNVRLPCDSPLIDNLDLSAWAERHFENINNNIDFERKVKRVKRSKTKTKTPTKTIRKPANSRPITIKVTNVTTNSVKLQNKYGGGNKIPVNSIPPRPLHSIQSNSPDTDVTYVLGVVPTSTPEKPLEVNIKIQYYFPTTQKTTTTVRPTQKKKKTPTRKPVLITQRPVTHRPQNIYENVVYSQGHNDVIVGSNDFFEKPSPTDIDNRPSYTVTDTKRPVHIYDRPTVDYVPLNSYNYNNAPSKRPNTRPQYYQDSYEYFSTSQRPYYHDDYSNKRPNARPQQSAYYDEIDDFVKRPPAQSNYDQTDPITDVYSYVFNDRIGDVPKKPTFGQYSYGDSTRHPDPVKKPTKIYSIAHVHKLDNDNVDDKLDFKTRLVTKPNHQDHDDGRFVKISSVKAGVILTDRNGDSYELRERDDDMDLMEQGDGTGEGKMRVVEIDVAPSEVDDSQWLVYDGSEEIMPLLPVPDINKNIPSSSELPRPMKHPKTKLKLQVKRDLSNSN